MRKPRSERNSKERAAEANPIDDPLQITSVRVLVEQIQLISRKCLNVIGDDVVK